MFSVAARLTTRLLTNAKPFRKVTCNWWYIYVPPFKDWSLKGQRVLCNISNTRDSVLSGYPNTEKRVENTTRSGIFLTKFKVFG